MTVTFDARSVADSFASGASTITVNAGDANNITIGSGSNRAVVFQISLANSGSAAPSVSSVVWDSGGSNQNAAVITGTPGTHTDTSFKRTELWGLIAPASGNLKLVVTLSGTTSDAYVSAVSYTGVDQTGGATSFAHGTTAGGTSTSPTFNVTSASGNAVVGTWTTDQAAISTASGTSVYIDNASGGFSSAAANYDIGAASVALTLTPNNAWVGSGVDVVAAASSSAKSSTLMMTGVG